MVKTKKWPGKVEQPKVDNTTFSLKSDVVDPSNLFLGEKISPGDGIAISTVESFENTYVRVTNTDHGIAHAALHAIGDPLSHISPMGTLGDVVSFNASGYPITDSGISLSTLTGIISASHDEQHAIDSVLDHTSTIVPGNIIDADANGLPHDSTITSAVLLAALIITGGVRTGRLTLTGGVPYNEVFTIGGVPEPLTATWIFAGDPRCFNNIPAKVDPVITNITAAGFTAQTTRDSVMTYTAINLI